MLTDFKKWTLLLCSISAILCIVAAFAPHWIYMQPESVAYGLYSSCSGNACSALNMTTLRNLEGCTSDDCAHPTVFHDRWWAVAAGAWMGVAWPLFGFLSVMVGFLRPIYKKGFYLSLMFFILLGLGSLAMTVGIFGATFSFSSASDVCSNVNGCVYWGASAMVMFAALASLGLAGICAIASWLVKSHRTAFLTATMFLCLCATCLAAGGACTGRWVIKLGQFENASPSSLLGTVSQCSGTSCKSLDRDTMIATTNALIVASNSQDMCSGTMPTASMLGSRMGAVVAFHVIAVIMAIGAGVAVLPADPYSRTAFGFVFAHFVCIIIGLSVYADSFGSWIGCGQSYCALLGTVQSSWACGWGVSFAVSVGAAFLSGILLLAYTFDLMCGGTYTLYGDDSKMLGTLPGFDRLADGSTAANGAKSDVDNAAAGDNAEGGIDTAVAIPAVVAQSEANVNTAAAMDDDAEEMAPVNSAPAAENRRGSEAGVPMLADTDDVEYVDAAGNPLDALTREAIARQVELDAAATGLGTAGFGATGGIRYPPGFLIGVANPINSTFAPVGGNNGTYAAGGTFIPTLQLQRSTATTPATARMQGRAVSSRPAQTVASSTARSFSVASVGPTSPSAASASVFTPAADTAVRMAAQNAAPQTEPAYNRRPNNGGHHGGDYSPPAPVTTRVGANGHPSAEAEADTMMVDDAAMTTAPSAPAGPAAYNNASAIPIVPPTKPSSAVAKSPKLAGSIPIPEVDLTAPPHSGRNGLDAPLPSAEAVAPAAEATPSRGGANGQQHYASPNDRSHVQVRMGEEEEHLPGSPDTSVRFSPRGQDQASHASPPK